MSWLENKPGANPHLLIGAVILGVIALLAMCKSSQRTLPPSDDPYYDAPTGTTGRGHY